MKADIKSNGILIISAKNGIESYALDKWMHENWDNCNGTLKPDRNRMFEIELNYKNTSDVKIDYEQLLKK